MVKGIIETVEDKAVEIDKVFYKLGPLVKPELIGTGPCEYSIDEDGETAKFIRMEKPVKKQRTFGKPKQADTSNDNSQFRDPAEIIREGCLNAAVKVMTSLNDEKGCTPENIINVSKKFEKYVIGTEEPGEE